MTDSQTDIHSGPHDRHDRQTYTVDHMADIALATLCPCDPAWPSTLLITTNLDVHMFNMRIAHISIFSSGWLSFVFWHIIE